MTTTQNVDIAIFGVDVKDGEKFAGELLHTLKRHNVLMEIVDWSNYHGIEVVKFKGDYDDIIRFGKEIYDVDEELVRETFFE